MEFKEAAVIKKANIYFDGKVTSRTIILSNGEKKTLGFMLPGEYTFTTGAAEMMEALGGAAEVTLPGETMPRTCWEVCANRHTFAGFALFW